MEYIYGPPEEEFPNSVKIAPPLASRRLTDQDGKDSYEIDQSPFMVGEPRGTSMLDKSFSLTEK